MEKIGSEEIIRKSTGDEGTLTRASSAMSTMSKSSISSVRSSVKLTQTLGHQKGLMKTAKMLMLIPYIISCSVISCTIPNLFVQMISASMP